MPIGMAYHLKRMNAHLDSDIKDKETERQLKLARQKNELLAQLRRETEKPETTAKVQKELVDLEARRRKLRETGF